MCRFLARFEEGSKVRNVHRPVPHRSDHALLWSPPMRSKIMIEHSPSAREDMKQGYVRQIRFRTCACRKRRMAKHQVLSSCTADLPAMEAQEKSSAIADIPLSWPQQSLTDLVGKCTHLQSDDLDCGPVRHHEKVLIMLRT